MERSKFGPFFTREVTFSQTSHVISFSHNISEQKIKKCKWLKSKNADGWTQMKAYANEFKKEIYSNKKRSVKGRKISVTYKKFGGKRLSSVQIHQSHHFHWDFSSSQSKLHCPCVLKFQFQFPKRWMNLSIRLAVTHHAFHLVLVSFAESSKSSS